ncbi:DUF4270 domain-containing protein [Pedobacter sp. L105]|uniref:DUF4270 domain-containing protein n=1 Tax=Pedobacter sp. L105 TaxID=1641871 RepID=UPI00131AFF2C|nr:DUF4270 domain-containing protein [Pedobacter sp. L105]
MKFSKLDLLTLLISLFLLSSCKDASTIGLNLDGTSKITGTLLDTVTVTSNTVTEIPASTYSSAVAIARYPLGYLNDPVFGITTSSLALAVNLPASAAYSFGKLPVIDSVVLVMPFSTDSAMVKNREFYGDSTSVFNITVSQLTTSLKTYSTFLDNQVYPSGDVLGTFTGAVKPNTKFKVISVITGAPDTAVVVEPQLRIKLNPALIQSKILGLDSLLLTSDYKFNMAFKGLKVTATTTNAHGAMMFLDFTTTVSNLQIYYKNQDATTATKRDTVVADFPIIGTSNPIAASVTHNYTGTPVATQLANPGVYQTTYMQAMGGVRTKISFPYLSKLKAQIGSNIVINKAELVIDTADPTDSIPFKFPARMSLYRYDIAGQRINLPDNNPYSSTNTSGDLRPVTSGIPFGGMFYPSKTYTFTVTDYVQDIIDGKQIDYGTYLAPTAFSEFDIYPTPNTAGRVVIGAGSNTNNRKIRLNIYYVKTGTTTK